MPAKESRGDDQSRAAEPEVSALASSSQGPRTSPAWRASQANEKFEDYWLQARRIFAEKGIPVERAVVQHWYSRDVTLNQLREAAEVAATAGMTGERGAGYAVGIVKNYLREQQRHAEQTRRRAEQLTATTNPPPLNHRRQWTAEHVARLHEFVVSGVSVAEMATLLGRTEGVVRDEIRKRYQSEIGILIKYGCTPPYEVRGWERQPRRCLYGRTSADDEGLAEPCYGFAEPGRLVCPEHASYQQAYLQERLASFGKFKVRSFADLRREFESSDGRNVDEGG